MLRTKKEVDRHVQDIFRKLQDEKEKNLRCYKIAELYFHVGDYESARRYLARYVEIRKEPKAHKLMGQILEALGQKDGALVQYKYAFELDGRQEDLVLKVCELLADPEVEIDINQARYWVERADKLFPQHKIVFQLKEKILNIERPNNNEQDLENLIKAELAARPTDVHLRIKLLKHYMDKNKLEEAYKHAMDIEAKNIHRDNILWYQAFCELLSKCKDNKHFNWSFWITYISAQERYAALSLKEHGNIIKKTSEAVQAVYNFDQHLFEAKAQSLSSYPSLTESIFLHMWGQLHFHMACLLLQNTKREQSSWSEAGRLCAPLLLTAMHVKPIDLTASWVTHLDAPMKSLLQQWYREGSYRCSQAGHVLLDYSRGNQKKLISNIEKFCTGSWRERIYQRIFVGKLYHKIRTSYFANNNSAMNAPLRLISSNELKRYDEVAEEVWPYSLHHQIWPAIKCRNMSSLHLIKHEGLQPHLTSHLFPDLPFSVYNLNQPSPVTLCRLDVDAFLNAAALCACAVAEEQQRNNLLNPDRLPTLPADLTNPLCTDDQEKWWVAAYKMYRKEPTDDVGETRQNLQRGLEVIRCIGCHGLHPVILVHLARIFQHRAKLLKEKNHESSDIPALEVRSELYWSAVVPLLERLQNNQTIRSSNIKLFDYIGKDMNNMEITHAIEEGKLLLAQKLLKDKLYEQAIEALQQLKCPEASFEQGKIFKRLADETMSNLPKENVTSEMRSQHVIILSKARNCFYLTLDRLRSPDADPKHPLNAELCTYISSVENELKRIDPDTLYNDRDVKGNFYRPSADAKNIVYKQRNIHLFTEVKDGFPSFCDYKKSVRSFKEIFQLMWKCEWHKEFGYIYVYRNRNDCDDISEESYSSAHSDEHAIVNNSLPVLNNSVNTPLRNVRRTPRQSSTPRHTQDFYDISRNRIEARPSPERLDAQLRQLVHSIESLREQNREQHRAMISRLDELIKISAHKESQKSHAQPPPPVQNQNLEDDLYGLYSEEDFRRSFDISSYSNTSLAPPTGSRTALSQNLFAVPTPRHPLQSLMYPLPATAAALQGYFQGGHLPFPDPAAAAAAAAASQHMQRLYSGATYPMGVYPPRSGLDQPPLGSMQQMTDNILQHGLFTQRLSGQLSDYSHSPQSQQPLLIAQQLGQQVSQMQIHEPAKSEPKLGFTPTIEASTPESSALIKDALSNSASAPTLCKPAPVNVVITTSDTLPTSAPPIQPMLSVTIPVQHRLGGVPTTNIKDKNAAPHSYQISMPSQAMIPTTVNLPPLAATMTVTSPATKTNVTDKQNSSILSTGSRHNSSDTTEVEHDPIPDFAPIIPLPDEVPVTTGEENEETLFCSRAKLFRFVDKEWKERGIGNVKLLKNATGKVRLLMRREQVLKICANHMLRKDMELTMMPNNDKAYIWVANDFADEELQLEKLCIRFKTAEEAANFKKHFDKARDSLPEDTNKPTEIKTSSTNKPVAKPAKLEPTQNKPVEKIGGFSFSTPPIIQKSTTEKPDSTTKKPEEITKPSPFASFTFGKQSDSTKAPPASTGFSFGSSSVSGAQTPMFGGQDLSKTTLRRPQATEAPKESEKGHVEDDEVVALEQFAEFLHFTNDMIKNVTIWNKQGSGIIKVLLDKSSGRVRLLMNNEDNTKTILNQIISAVVVFNIEEHTVNWTTVCDECRSENFMLRFINYDQALLFQKTMSSLVQKSFKPSDKAITIEKKSLSELFKPAAGSWECQECYTRNNATDKICVSCQAPSPATAIATVPPRPTIQSISKNLFDKFKPPPGSWDCKDCYTRNNAGTITCAACQAPAPTGNLPVATSMPNSVPTSMPASTPNVCKPLSDMFKPPAGSWECKDCYTCNTQSNQYCAACDAPKDPSMPPKPKTTGGFLINSQAPDNKPTFSFGIPQASQQSAVAESSSFSFNLSSKSSEKTVSSPIAIFSGNKSATANTSGYLFGTQPLSTPPKSTGPFTFGSPGKSFDFQFQARSPPVKSPERPETSDDEVIEEAEDVYFPPVIPLPDKVDVKTGEENEDIMYSHRAKLFKYDTTTKEWKERGLGDIKLLRHQDTKKLRLVMRRDQVLKLCLNHAVTADLEITSKDEKTWMWSAGDYSEGEIEYMQFACRFKAPEIAQEFKKAVDDACKGIGFTSSTTVTSTTTKESSSNKDSSEDLEIIYEVKVTPEEKAAALKLQLPENFYAYKYKADCPGCIGCRDSDESLFKTNTDNAVSQQPATTFSATPIFGKTSVITPITTSQPVFSNVFGKPAAATTASTTQLAFGTSTPPIFGGGKNIFENGSTGIKPPSFVFGASKTDTNIAATTSAPTNVFGGFGGTTATTASTNMFSSTFSTTSAPASTTLGMTLFGGSNTAPATTGTELFSTGGLFNKSPFVGCKPNVSTENKEPVSPAIIFGGGSPAATTNIFGGEPKAPAASTNIFGGETKAPATTSNVLFPKSGTTTITTSNIFGGEAKIPVASSNIFSSPKLQTTSNIFGSSNIFGAPSTLNQSIVATTTTSSTGPIPIFGGGQTTFTPTFGSLATQDNTQGMQLGAFGVSFGSIANAKSTAPVTTATTAAPAFGSAFGSNNATPTTNVFLNTTPNSTTANIFVNKTTETKKDNFLPTENSLSFSELAAQTAAEQPAFDTDPNFTFAGAGTSVFGASTKQAISKKTPSKNSPNVKKEKGKEDDEEGEENENGDDHDPYFEPIIPLPDAIEVRTGEEDEEKVFCQRAKLYRYDQNTKEWKERGTGEMKLLHHAGHGTYRLLLRREQVHKVVCNLLLTPDLEFRELNSSDRAWVWAGMNYAEPENPEVEQLAVKFKSPELATQFKEAIDKAQQTLAQRQNQGPKVSYDDNQGDENYDEDDYVEDDDYEDEEDEEDEEDDGQYMKMFEKRATLYTQNEGETTWQPLGMGNLRVIYDSDIFGAKIIVENDSKEITSETIISMDTSMKCIDKDCTWAALDYACDPPTRRTLRAVFSSTQTSQEMYQTFQDGQECATKAGIQE